jgi:hypothetical protein
VFPETPATNETIDEPLTVRKETYWKLLTLDFENGKQPDFYKVSLVCFILVDYILHSVANTHGATRKYLIDNLFEQLMPEASARGEVAGI